MKKILLLAFAMTLALFACGNSQRKSANDSVQNDSTQIDTLRVCGIAIDGAMNSIYLKTAVGDSLSFGYPELNPSKRVSWMIGDTVSITYIKVDGMDSVLYMSKGCI